MEQYKEALEALDFSENYIKRTKYADGFSYNLLRSILLRKIAPNPKETS